MPLALFFFFSMALAVRGLLQLPTFGIFRIFRITCCSSVKNAAGIFIGIALNLYMAKSTGLNVRLG